jgi:K+-sensing histidine kinase KdpD
MTETISMLSTQLALTIENLFIHQSLESKVAERTKQLAIANRAKSEFLANMTHEIRTPMNSIIGMTSLVLNSELKREQRDYLDKVQSASNKLLKLINNILDFSKMESGHLSLESTRFYLTDTLQNTINLFAILLEEKKLNLALDIGNDVPKWIIGDSLRLSQVMNNLLGNAIKFTERGEIQIKVDRIPLATKMASKQMLRFRVIDTGIGISNHYLEKLFSAFTQGDPSISRRFGGTGLGLSISKSLVELMGGEISVTSQEGQGSTFTFTAAFGISPDHETLSSIPEKGNINEKTLLIPKLVSGLAEEYHQAEFSTIDLESLRTLLIELEALLATNRLKAKKVSQKIELLLENSALFSEYIPVSLYIRKMLYREALSAFKTFQAYLNARYSDVSLNESI